MRTTIEPSALQIDPYKNNSRPPKDFMKHPLRYLALGLLLAGCIDGTSPTAVQTSNPADGPNWMPLPKISLPNVSAKGTVTSHPFSLDVLGPSASMIAEIPVYGVSGLGFPVFPSGGSRATFVIGTVPPGYLDVAPLAIMLSPNLTTPAGLFRGQTFGMNQQLMAVGVKCTNALCTEPQPILYNLATRLYLVLPVPDGATDVLPIDLGAGKTPIIVGYASDSDAHSVALIWRYNRATHAYEVSELERPGGVPGFAVGISVAGIVGQLDGHPARWNLDGSVLDVATEIGRFSDINKAGVAVGVTDDAIGILSVGPGVTESLGDFRPRSINDAGYIIGTTSTATLRLLTGVLRPLAAEDPSMPPFATFLSNDGLIGGFYGDFNPVTWSFPLGPDADKDKIPDDMDNCPSYKNPTQQDDDANLVGDVCEAGHPPTIDTAPATTTNSTEGKMVSLKTTATDPLGRSLTFSWSFTDGGTASGGGAKHVFEDEGTYTGTLSVTNGYDTVTQDFTFVIANVAPKVSVTVDKTGTVGVAVPIAIDFNDAGIHDDVAFTIDYGDGSPLDTGECGGHSCTVNRTHTYSTARKFTIRFNGHDNDGGATMVTKTITIAGGGI